MESGSKLSWLISILLGVFIIVPPYFKALFDGGTFTFLAPIFGTMILTSTVLIFTMIYFFLKPQKVSIFLLLIVWLIPATYLISSFISPASAYSASFHVFQQVMHVSLLFAGMLLMQQKNGLKHVTITIVFSGYLVSLHGLLTWFGLVKYQDALLDGRLSGVFQYPNTYAAYLIFLFFAGLMLFYGEENRRIKALHLFMQLPIMFSLILTDSRGGLVAYPVVLIVFLLLMKGHKQLLAFAQTVVTIGFSLLLTKLLFSLKESGSIWGLLLLLTASAIYSAVIFWSNKKLSPQLGEKLKFWMLPLLVTLFVDAASILYLTSGTLPFLSEISPRLGSINASENSFLSRSAFYVDSLKIVKENPIFGVGGGGWFNLFEIYKSFPYTSRQAHNYLLQYLVSAGIVGFMVLLALLYLTGYSFLKAIKDTRYTRDKGYLNVLFLLIVILLVHSLIDFDMSFLYLSSLVFLSIGFIISAGFRTMAPNKRPFITKCIAVLGIAIGLVSLGHSVQNVRAINEFNNVNEMLRSGQADFRTVVEGLDHSIGLSKGQPAFKIQKIAVYLEVYRQTKNDQYLSDAQKMTTDLMAKEPSNRQLIEQQYYLYMVSNQTDKANEFAELMLQKFVWDNNFYANLITNYATLGFSKYNEGAFEEANSYWDKAIQVHEKMLSQQELIPEKLPHYKRAFVFDSNVGLTLGKVYYLKKDYSSAEQILRQGLSKIPDDMNNPLNRELTRFYLAALGKQGKENPRMFERLVAQDPSEKEQIEGLLALK